MSSHSAARKHDRQPRRLLALAVVLALAAAGGPASAGPGVGSGKSGFLTDQSAMLTALGGASVLPIITVGETLGGYRFEAIPDGISVMAGKKGAVDAYVNHETSTVPFPYVLPEPNIENSRNDFDNAQVSHLRLSLENAGVLKGKLVIRSRSNFQRFCSNFLATAAEGFDMPLLFTNEEATDLVNRTGEAWPAGEDAEQAGLVVAFDPQTKQSRSIYGLGRMNHENTVAIPGYDQAVLLTDDDTFAAPSAQLYMYLAADRSAVWNDQGTLYGFVSDDPLINDYGDMSGASSVSGSFLQVPDEIADGDQTGLETWSNDNNVFQFIRTEDIAYDRNTPNVVYVGDTGEPRAIADPETGRLKRGPSGTEGPWPNGRVFRMELNPEDPLQVDSFSILIDADEGGYDNPDAVHNIDNLETTENSILIQEDPGSHNQVAPGDPVWPTARIWLYDLALGTLTEVARVDQSGDPLANLGAWESSGIVDVSDFFGPGTFLVDVQAHTIFVETAPGPDQLPPEGPDWLYKREGGQLLLLTIPGA
jgi:hypothetical protein